MDIINSQYVRNRITVHESALLLAAQLTSVSGKPVYLTLPINLMSSKFSVVSINIALCTIT
jgi:hypothetical protein